MTRRYFPNIIVTGTPGCGKTSHSENIINQVESKNYKVLSISEIAKERDCIESYDSKLDTSVVDEDRLLDSLEVDLREGGKIVDWHCCDIFPERLIDLVVVLKTEPSILFERLSKRGYKDNKIQENLDCEIMEIIYQDAQESYLPEIVICLNSNSVEEMDENVDRIVAWIDNWVKDHKKGVTNEIDPELMAKKEAEEAEEADSDDEVDAEESDDEEDEEEESD